MGIILQQDRGLASTHEINAMDRSNPYEAAFEAYLQSLKLCYVAVDETRRAPLGDHPVKNLDFIVLGANGGRLLIDVKGRRFPGGPAAKPRYVWENWATEEDIDGLSRWREVFGTAYMPMFVFVYRIEPTVTVPEDSIDLWTFRERKYLLRAVAFDEYVQAMKVRSPKWRTVSLPGSIFRSIARPFRHFTHDPIFAAEDRSPHGQAQNWRVPEIDPFAASSGAEPDAAPWSDGD